jgi:protein-S-isoprenylcysteine O-methyltransferase
MEAAGEQMIQRILLIMVVLFPVSEVALSLVKHSRGESARSEDQGSLRLLWLSIAAGVGLAITAQQVSWARFQGPLSIVCVAALVLMVGGLALRWAAILTLGSLFTVDVAIHTDHTVVQTGLYRFVRHPSYTGLLVAFLGLGIFFDNWLSLVGLLVPITCGVLWRVAKEERALLDALGPAYAAYRARTKRFIPWLV